MEVLLIPKKKPDQQAIAKRIMANVEASMAIKGMKPSRKSRTIGKQYLERKISSEEAIEKIKEHRAAKFDK